MSNNFKVNAVDVEIIRRLAKRGYRTRDIAAIFDIKPNTVRSIVLRRTWK